MTCISQYTKKHGRTILFSRINRSTPARRAAFTLAGLFLFLHAAAAQRVSFGFVGGTNLTHDFPATRDPRVPHSLVDIDRYSDRHGLIAGLSVEVDLGRGLSVEANALRRQLETRLRTIFPDGKVDDSYRKEIGTWEWPVLLKYRLPASRSVRPFVEGGPSFRTRHDPAPGEPSQFGGTAGAGLDLLFGRIRVSPTLRYTRWRYDGDFPRIATKRDQVEFVTGISYATSVPSWRIGNRKVRFGLVGGMPLTGGLAQLRFPERLDEEQGYMAGIAAELELNRRVSIEVNGLYRPFRAHSYGGILDPTGALRTDTHAFEFTVVTWQFPVLAKVRLSPERRLQPVLEAGPSFRAAGNLNGYRPSRYGFTAGGGIEWAHGTLRFTPVLRYTRWAQDADPLQSPLFPSQPAPAPAAFGSPRTGRNQVELVVGWTF